jgi:hypothetical protein
VKEHGRAALGRRLTYDALRFVQYYVFPPSHRELLSVRGMYKKQDAREEEQSSEEALAGYDSEADSDQKT